MASVMIAETTTDFFLIIGAWIVVYALVVYAGKKIYQRKR